MRLFPMPWRNRPSRASGHCANLIRFPIILALLSCAVRGQDAPAGNASGRFWLSGQANFITQGHTTFDAPYSGPNSLAPDAQIVTSRVITLYTGIRLTN